MVAIALVVAVAAVAADAPGLESPELAKLHYRQLQEARYAVRGVDVPSGGIDVRIDAATFHLQSGTIRPMEPIAGVVTGWLFAGKGRFRFEVPSAFERAQLKRFSRGESSDAVDTAFSMLLVRSADPRLVDVVTWPSPLEYAPYGPAADRRESWAKDWRKDVDARIVAATRNPDDRFVLADVKTEAYGWMSVELEPWRAEELTLSRLPAAGGFVETWVSLDQASERDDAGNPTSDTRRLYDVTHVEIAADLGNHRGELLVPVAPEFENPIALPTAGAPLPDPIAFRVRLDAIAGVDGLLALPFELDPRAEVSAVRAADGTPLQFLRDDYGKKYVTVGDDVSVAGLVVLLERPLLRTETFSLEFEYRMRTLNFVSGRRWYPGPPDPYRDTHTARATITGASRLDVRAVGDLVSNTVDGDRRTTVWTVDRPTKMYGFSFGAKFKEESIKLDGAPEVLAFGVSTGAVFGKMVRNVAVDIARAEKFYADYFDLPLGQPVLRATAISGHHGQAFDGFLHLAQSTFNEEHPGQSELFRAHEVAHQYWGHLVGWKGYRDQWLSEAFAEYSALLFVESVLPKDKYFDAMIQDLMAFQLGSAKGGTVFYDPMFAVSITPELRGDLGPIAAGWRASTARAPYGYYFQIYGKGALVLHTMRTVMASLSREDLFRKVLSDFLKAYRGKDASTEDFIRFLKPRVPFAWDPFFEAYVYGTEIPTFAWRWRFSDESGKRVIDLTVEASHVPDGFALPIPVAIEFADHQVRYTFVSMDGASKTFHIPVPVMPVRVVLNPRNGVLARVEALP